MSANPPATVFADIAAEVEIPKDGTLSRVLYKDGRLRVVVFAFDADQELTEHSTPLAAIVQVVSGRLRLALGEEAVEIGPGSWVHMPPGLPHTVRALEPSVMLLSMVRGVT
jgi:quercetin dioxygenase-like cupin family protein